MDLSVGYYGTLRILDFFESINLFCFAPTLLSVENPHKVLNKLPQMIYCIRGGSIFISIPPIRDYCCFQLGTT